MYIIDGKKLIPVETADISRRSERTEAGVKQRSVFDITIKGTLVAFKGSPTSSGTWWTQPDYPPDEEIAAESRLTSILTKQGALSELLCGENVWHEIQPRDGSLPTKFVPRVNNVQFSPNVWFDKCEFSIVMEADRIYFGDRMVDCGNSSTVDGKPLVDEETWSINQADEIGRVYTLSHSVMAQRNGSLDPEGNISSSGWQYARDAVLAHLGFNPTHLYASGVLNLTGFQPYNHSRTQTVSETEQRFSVEESWTCFNPTDNVGNGIPAIEEYTAEVRTNSQDGITSVAIQGSIEGLYIRDPDTFAITTTKWANAQAKFAAVSGAVYERALAYASVDPAVLASSRSYNPIQGRIDYSYEYSSKATPDVDGVIAINTTIEDDYQADVFATLPILNRLSGPLLQDMDTVTPASRTVNVELILSPSAVAPINWTLAYALSFAPVANTVFVERNRGSWAIEAGRYSRSITFVYGN